MVKFEKEIHKHESNDLFSRQMAIYFIAMAAIYLVISLIMFWPIATNITNIVASSFNSGDSYLILWGLWWVKYSLLTLHSSIYSTNLVFYPVGANLVTQTLMPLAGILTIPLQSISLAFAYNLIFFLGFCLSGLFMAMLAYYITGNKHAAFIAGLIFAFSPMHIAQSYIHLDWNSVEFIPLFILLFLITINKPRYKYAILASIALLFVIFFGDIEEGIMISVFLILFVGYTFVSNYKDSFSQKNKSMLIGFSEIIIFTLIIGSPFFIPLISGILHSSALTIAQEGQTIPQELSRSNDLATLFIPGAHNAILNPISASFSYLYVVSGDERTWYLGYTVIFLLLFGAAYEFNRNGLKTAAIWIFIGIVFALLSLGPYVQLNGVNTGLPGLYLIYRNIPLFNIIREPGRFDVFVTVCLAIFCALGMNAISAHIKNKKGAASKNMEICVVALISILILIEYNGMPLSMNSNNFISTNIPNLYYSLANSTCNCSVLILPIGKSTLYSGMEMYYQTIFKKPIIGAYLSRQNDTQVSSVQNIPLSQWYNFSSSGVENYSYPISENYTQLNLFWFNKDQIGFVTAIPSAYGKSFKQLIMYLTKEFGQPQFSDNSTDIFYVQPTVNQNWNRSLIAYVTGKWEKIFTLCNYYGCGNVSYLWQFDNSSGITLFSPQPKMKVIMSFQGISSTPLPLSISLNGQTIATVNITTTISSYSLNLTTFNGINHLKLYPNFSSNISNATFGIRNISFVPNNSMYQAVNSS